MCKISQWYCSLYGNIPVYFTGLPKYRYYISYFQYHYGTVGGSNRKSLGVLVMTFWTIHFGSYTLNFLDTILTWFNYVRENRARQEGCATSAIEQSPSFFLRRAQILLTTDCNAGVIVQLLCIRSTLHYTCERVQSRYEVRTNDALNLYSHFLAQFLQYLRFFSMLFRCY